MREKVNLLTCGEVTDYDVVELQMQILFLNEALGIWKVIDDTTVNIFDLLRNYEWTDKFEQGSELELQTN